MLSVEAFWADFKVGLRMLVKHPVLTLIGTVATTFAIGAGGAYFEIVNDYSRPTLPLQEGQLVQLALGAGLGALASLTFLGSTPDSHIATPGTVGLVLAFMMVVGFVSCGPPARRALRIQPTEAMREDQ